jgi:hypothetical protein
MKDLRAQERTARREAPDSPGSPTNERHSELRARFRRLVAKIFHFKSLYGNLALSYQPDSLATSKAYPEFDKLFRSFTKHNKLNNAGDFPRLFSYLLNIRQVLEENVEGDFAEVGVWRGNTASVLAHFASQSNRRVYLFDTYEGFSTRDIHGVDADKDATSFSNTSIALVEEVLGEDSQCCHFVKGHFPASLSEVHEARRYAVVSLDCDLYAPMKAGLNVFYPLMSTGGILLLHDYSSQYWDGAKLAIDEFCKEVGEFVILMPDKSGSAFLRKTRS